MKSVLIVDDSASIRHLMRTFLESHNIGVCGEAADGVDAVSQARELKPDLILLDLSMPRMNGLEAARALQHVMPTVPKILFTSYRDAVPNQIATSVGINAVVGKVEGMNPLIEEIRRLIYS
jgi:two-component system, NarL family, response regulator EvgA